MLQLAQMQAAVQNPLASNPFSLSLNQPQRFSTVGLPPQQQQQQRPTQQSVVQQASQLNQLHNQLGLQSQLATLQQSQLSNSAFLAATYGSQQIPAGYTLSYNHDTNNQFLADPRRYLDPNSPPITTSTTHPQSTSTSTTQQQNPNPSSNNSYLSSVNSQQASPQAQLTAASNSQSSQAAGINLASLLQQQQQTGSSIGGSQVGSSVTSPYGLSTSANSAVNANNPNYMTAQAMQ